MLGCGIPKRENLLYSISDETNTQEVFYETEKLYHKIIRNKRCST